MRKRSRKQILFQSVIRLIRFCTHARFSKQPSKQHSKQLKSKLIKRDSDVRHQISIKSSLQFTNSDSSKKDHKHSLRRDLLHYQPKNALSCNLVQELS
jgi:hypothetical protein